MNELLAFLRHHKKWWLLPLLGLLALMAGLALLSHPALESHIYPLF